MSFPELIFGTSTVGTSFTTKEDVLTVVEALKKASVSRVDTAGRYPPTRPGESQKLLGQARVAEQGFTIDTKIALVGSDPSGSLSPAAIEKSIAESLASLGVNKVNVLYCHAPDYATPLEDQAAACDKYYKLGNFNYLGVSNFKPEMIEKWMEISNEKGYIKPSIYQGQYNLFCRGYEQTLFPVLRKHGMHFAAFSPLAGGFLTGKLTQSTKTEDLAGTRFESGNVMGRALRHWYDKPSMYKGLESLEQLCKKYDTPMDEASLRWLVYHSILNAGDGVILGASKVAQVEGNLVAISHGPLPDDFAKGLDDLWEVVKDEAKSIV